MPPPTPLPSASLFVQTQAGGSGWGELQQAIASDDPSTIAAALATLTPEQNLELQRALSERQHALSGPAPTGTSPMMAPLMGAWQQQPHDVSMATTTPAPALSHDERPQPPRHVRETFAQELVAAGASTATFGDWASTMRGMLTREGILRSAARQQERGGGGSGSMTGRDAHAAYSPSSHPPSPPCSTAHASSLGLCCMGPVGTACASGLESSA